MDDLWSGCQCKVKKRQHSGEELVPTCLPTGDLSSEPWKVRADFAGCGTESAWSDTLNRNKINHFKRCPANHPWHWAGNKTFPNQSQQDWYLLDLFWLIVGVAKVLKSLSAATVREKQPQAVFCGWAHGCLAVPILGGRQSWGLPGWGVSSIVVVLGQEAECPCNKAAPPTMPEGTSGRGTSAWLTRFPPSLVTDGSDNFLQSFPPKTGDNGSSKGASIWIKAGDPDCTTSNSL